MTRPAVTALIDTYNHERFVEEAIVSALEQDFPSSDMEILVVDDGSTDRTHEIVQKFAPQVRCLRKENGGQASAFNFGIPQAQGEVIAFLDGDDWWEKFKVTEVMTTFEKNPWAGAVGHGIIHHDSITGTSAARSPDFSGCFDIQSSKGARTFRNYMFYLGTSRASIRRSVLERVLPIPQALLVAADEFMSAMSVAYSSAVLLPACLTHYRHHDQKQYQFSADDRERMRRKLNSLTCLAEELTAQLAATGIPEQSIEIIVDPILVAVGRLKLTLDGGMPWQTYLVEQEYFQIYHSSAPFGERIYRQLSLLLTLIVPPRTYYKLRNLYAEGVLHRSPSWTGEPSLAAPIQEKPLSHSQLRGNK